MSFCVSLVIVIITHNKIIWLSGAESRPCWWAHGYRQVKGLNVPAAGCWVARSACSACRHLHFRFWLPGSWPVLLSTGEENQRSCEHWWILFISQRMNSLKRSYYLWWWWWWCVCDMCSVTSQLTCVVVRAQLWQRSNAGFWVLDSGLGMPSLYSVRALVVARRIASCAILWTTDIFSKQTCFPAVSIQAVLPVLSVFLLTVVEMSELMQFIIRIHLYSKIKLFCYSFNFFQERNNSITWLILTPICVMWWSGNHRPSKAAVNSCSCHLFLIENLVTCFQEWAETSPPSSTMFLFPSLLPPSFLFFLFLSLLSFLPILPILPSFSPFLSSLSLFTPLLCSLSFSKSTILQYGDNWLFHLQLCYEIDQWRAQAE